jgi:endoglucanase
MYGGRSSTSADADKVPGMLDRRRFIAATAAVTAGALWPAVPARAADPAPFAADARGVNVPRWLDQDDSAPPSDAVLDRLLEMGFTTLRLPVDVASDARQLRRVDEALRRLDRLGMAAILDMHPGGTMRALLESSPAEAHDAVAASWRDLSRVAAGYSPRRVALELLNEPPMEADIWLPLRDRLAGIVRENAPHHPIVYGAARYQGIWETVAQPPLADTNAIAAVHFYWPMGFTHQCQNWIDSPNARIGDLPFPATLDDPRIAAIRSALQQSGDLEALQALDTEYALPWNEALIAGDFIEISAWSSKNETPVLLNEFGAYGACVDPVSRAAWIAAVRRAAETVGIGWTYWELDDGFGLMTDRTDANSFDNGVIKALRS